MYTEFHISANELDDEFIKAIRKMFKSKRISIIVEEDKDETNYLLKNESNRKMLLNSKKQAEKGQFISFDPKSKKK